MYDVWFIKTEPLPGVSSSVFALLSSAGSETIEAIECPECDPELQIVGLELNTRSRDLYPGQKMLY